MTIALSIIQFILYALAFKGVYNTAMNMMFYIRNDLKPSNSEENLNVLAIMVLLPLAIVLGNFIPT